MNDKLIPVAVVVVVMAAVGSYLYHCPRQSDCMFSGWKNTIGVELETEIQSVSTVKGKVGITDAQVREFDTLMKDYALKYDTACQDFLKKRISDAEYTCRRQNMDRVLDDLRQFHLALEQAKTVADPSAQKEVVFKALDILRLSSQAQYRTGCTSAVDVNPRSLTYAGLIPERSILVTNRGNNNLFFSVDGLPEAFHPYPPGGSLPRGVTLTVSILRTLFPVPESRPIRFHVRTNLQDDVEIEITTDSENTQLYQRLGNQVIDAARKANRQPTPADAFKVVGDLLPEGTSANRGVLIDYVAAGIFSQMGRNAEAQHALDAAIHKDPSLGQQAPTLMLYGIIADQQDKPDRALEYFATAKNHSAPTDSKFKALSDLFSAAIQLRRGYRPSAMAYLSNPAVMEQIQRDPNLLNFAEKQFRSTQLGVEAAKGPEIIKYMTIG